MAKFNQWPSAKMVKFVFQMANGINGQKNDHVESYKEFVKKLAESKKPITKSSQVENLAKCQTNLTSEAQVAKCRIRVPDQVSQFSQGHKLAEILKVNGKFWVESRLVNEIFLHDPLLSGAR